MEEEDPLGRSVTIEASTTRDSSFSGFCFSSYWLSLRVSLVSGDFVVGGGLSAVEKRHELFNVILVESGFTDEVVESKPKEDSSSDTSFSEWDKEEDSWLEVKSLKGNSKEDWGGRE